MKKAWLASILAMLLLVVTACGGNTAPTPAPNTGTGTDTNNTAAPPKQEQVELRIMWWGDQKRADRTNEALRDFESKNPHIKIIGEFSPASGYFDKLNTQLASGTAPDVFFLGGNVVDYVNKDVLLDLTPYIGNELDLSDMDNSLIDYGTFNNQLLHVSAGGNARGIVINTKLFEQAGMPIPQDGWNWEDYANISKEIAGKLGSGVYGTYDLTVDGMDISLKQKGKQLYEMENSQLGFVQEDVLDWFQYWDDLRKAGGVVTPELQVSNPPDDTSKTLIVTGKVAMNLIASNQLVGHQNMTEDPLTLVQVPRGDKGTGVVFESSQGLSGYAKSKHPKEVAQLMNYWINDPDAAKILGNDRGVPVTSKMRDLLKTDASELEQIIYDYTSRVSEAVKTEPFQVSYNPPGFTEYDKLADSTVLEIAFGRKSVEKGVADFYNGVVKIFEKQQ